MSYRNYLTLLLASAASSAFAQGSAQPETASASASEGEIIVTAQKREERQLDVPITISAVTGERLRQLGVADLDELAFYVPGLNVQEQSANNPGIVIRGITSDSGSSQQAARVTVYYNGVDISRSRGVYQDIYDVERIEVVKGPQATLFGTASTIGAISIISAKPEPGFSGQVQGGYGNFEQIQGSGFLNLGNDVFAGRIAVAFKKRDGYVTNLAPNQDDLNGQNQLGARGSLRWTPTDTASVDLVLTYDRQRNPGTAFVSRALPTAAGPGDPFGVANLGGSPFSREVLGLAKLGLKRDVYDANLTATFDLSEQWSLTVINAYRRFDSLEVFDADGSAAWYLEFAEDSRGDQFNHESRFTYTSDTLRGSFGFNFFHENNSQAVPFSSEEGIFLQCAARVVPGLPCIAPNGVVTAAQATALISGGRLTQAPYSSEFKNLGRNDQYSVFADATYEPVQWLELTAGARVLIEKRRSGFFARVPRPILNPAATSLIPGQVDTRGQTFRTEDSFQSLLPRFNVLGRFSETTNAYATVSKGRRSPVVQLDAAPGGIPRIQNVLEEKVWNYEVGLKHSSPLFSASVGAFIQKYDNFQVTVTLPTGATQTQSAGTASNKGVEFETEIRPVRWARLFGNVAYIDASIDNRADIAPTFRGARFRLQPKWQAAGGIIIDAPITDTVRFFAAPTITHRSGLFFELPNNPATFQKAVTLVNLRAGLGLNMDGREIEIAGYARNLFNKDYLLDAGNTGGAFGIPTYIPAEPRLYGIQASMRF